MVTYTRGYRYCATGSYFVGYSRAERESGTPSILQKSIRKTISKAKNHFGLGLGFADDELYYHGIPILGTHFDWIGCCYDDEIG